jgi:hypothetical protein
MIERGYVTRLLTNVAVGGVVFLLISRFTPELCGRATKTQSALYAVSGVLALYVAFLRGGGLGASNAYARWVPALAGSLVVAWMVMGTAWTRVGAGIFVLCAVRAAIVAPDVLSGSAPPVRHGPTPYRVLSETPGHDESQLNIAFVGVLGAVSIIILTSVVHDPLALSRPHAWGLILGYAGAVLALLGRQVLTPRRPGAGDDVGALVRSCGWVLGALISTRVVRENQTPGDRLLRGVVQWPERAMRRESSDEFVALIDPGCTFSEDTHVAALTIFRSGQAEFVRYLPSRVPSRSAHESYAAPIRILSRNDGERSRLMRVFDLLARNDVDQSAGAAGCAMVATLSDRTGSVRRFGGIVRESVRREALALLGREYMDQYSIVVGREGGQVQCVRSSSFPEDCIFFRGGSWVGLRHSADPASWCSGALVPGAELDALLRQLPMTRQTPSNRTFCEACRPLDGMERLVEKFVQRCR